MFSFFVLLQIVQFHYSETLYNCNVYKYKCNNLLSRNMFKHFCIAQCNLQPILQINLTLGKYKLILEYCEVCPVLFKNG